MTTANPDRDRLRELLDAVLREGNDSLDDMAGDAFASPYHFNRQLRRAAGEPPVTMKRRVLLERAAWQLANGSSVTDAAWAAGYESVEGFSRAFQRGFGHPPSAVGHTDPRPWLPAPNGIHFHPPTSLWVHTTEQPMNPLTDQLVGHDLDDTRHLLGLAKGLTVEEFALARLPGHTVLSWDGPDDSIRAVLEHLVWTKEVWLAAIAGESWPARDEGSDAAALLERHERVAPRWLATVRDIDARGGWDDRLIDALCDPPESFVMSSVIAHVVEYSAYRRQLARSMFRAAGHEVDQGDPIEWLRSRHAREQA